MKTIRLALAAVLLLSAPATFAQKKKGGETTRSVQGTVTVADDSPVIGAVVQLKNTKTLQIRSFITKEDGTYHFYDLSPDIDYEIRGESQGLTSPAKTLSSFDTRKEAIINLKLSKK